MKTVRKWEDLPTESLKERINRDTFIKLRVVYDEESDPYGNIACWFLLTTTVGADRWYQAIADEDYYSMPEG